MIADRPQSGRRLYGNLPDGTGTGHMNYTSGDRTESTVRERGAMQLNYHFAIES